MPKKLLNTDAVDGLRALAVMHIVLGHHSFFTGYRGDAREGEDGVQERYSRGLGGASMGLFYEAPARLVAQHQNLAKRRTVLELLSQGYLAYSVPSDEKLLETSRGLGTGGPAASRHRCQQRARGGESKERSWLDCCLR